MTALVPAFGSGAYVSPGLVPAVQSPHLCWEAVPAVLRDPLGPRLMLWFALAQGIGNAIAGAGVALIAVGCALFPKSVPDRARGAFASDCGDVIPGTPGVAS